MGIKQIVVPLSGIGNPTKLVAMALKLGQKLDAHVEGCDAVPLAVPVVDETGMGTLAMGYGELYKINAKIMNDRRAAARKTFEDACGKAGVARDGRPSRKGATASWTAMPENIDRAALAFARLGDLIVTSLPGRDGNFADSDLLQQYVFATGRPVLAIPEGGGNELSGRAAIAWNGSVEAARAVKGALPLLQLGKGVDILQVGDVAIADATGLAGYLMRHGIKSRIRMLKDRKGGTAKLLEETAVDAGCGLMVMGAYSRSPLREMVLGGVTRYMFDDAGLPLLLAH